MNKRDKGTLETEEKSELKRLRKMEKTHKEALQAQNLSIPSLYG